MNSSAAASAEPFPQYVWGNLSHQAGGWTNTLVWLFSSCWDASSLHPLWLLPVLAHLNLDLFHFPTSAFKSLGLPTKCFCVICNDTENLGQIVTLINIRTTAVELCGCKGGCNLAFLVIFRSIW